MGIRSVDGKAGRDILAVVIVAGIGVMMGLNLYFLLGGDGEDSMVGQMAPEFELSVLGEERQVSLGDYRGRVVVMDFWATWCPPCREQMPVLEAVAADSEWAESLVVLSINTDQSEEGRVKRVEAFVRELDLDLPVLADNGMVRTLYGVGVIPTLVVVNRDGMVVHKGEGIYEEASLRALIREADASL